MKAVIELLLKNGWVEDGATRRTSFRLSSLAYGGGPLVTLGGRVRLQKGTWKVTVGKRTTCFYRKPESPETIAGAGRLAGKQVYTFKDWEQTNIPTKDIEQIKIFLEKCTECSLCRGSEKVLRLPERTMGYTLAEGETTENTLDEHYEPCPLCVKVIK